MKNPAVNITHESFSDITPSPTLWIVGAFATDDNKSALTIKSVSKSILKQLEEFSWFKTFKGASGQQIVINLTKDINLLIVGLGKEADYNTEKFRRSLASAAKSIKGKGIPSSTIVLPSFVSKKISEVELFEASIQATILSQYEFNKYKTGTNKQGKEETTHFVLQTNHRPDALMNEKLNDQLNICESINFSRDLTNECPMILTPSEMAKRIELDAKKNLKHVSIKILDKKMIKKENMNLLLAVNAGSTEEPRFVHLHYKPTKSSNKKGKSSTKHVCLVGKGVTYDTGGYSLKPSTSMAGMKMDMAGASTIYGIFRAAVLNQHQGELSCLLAITDNKVSGDAIVPDAIITARSGKTVEILNTDAEGRLILADALDYASDLKPDYIIDAATLTGAMLVSLGSHVCGMFSNDKKLVSSLLESAETVDEYLWQLPIVQEYRDDMKSKVADIKNIGSPGKNGSAQGALFLESFVKHNIPWAHLDIAGVADTQTHLPYCPPHGASGIMIRTVYEFLQSNSSK
jgi:leucyl aminopeptidase